MSWHFSQALVAEFLPASCSDGGASVPWSSAPIAHDDSCSDKLKDTCHLSPSGTMFVPSWDGLGEALLMSFLAAFPAKTSASSVAETGLKEIEADCGSTWPASFAKYDRAASSWKTAQLSLLGDLTEFSETWPSWGLMRDGECWELTLSERITDATESGLLPTPLKHDYKAGTASLRKDGKSRLGEWKHYVRAKYGLTYPHPTHSELRMGWPEGWSDCKPLAMDRFQQWLQQHGDCSAAPESTNA